jgi:hypothetical protein
MPLPSISFHFLLCLSHLSASQRIKKKLFFVFPSRKIIVQNIQSYRKQWSLWWGPAGRFMTQLAHLMCRVDCPHPSPHIFTCLICMWGELYKHWVQGDNASIHIVAVTLFCDTLVLITSL